jgi:hypothetical protein
MWIWELGLCERGDLAAITARAKASGVRWIAIKAGEEHANGQVTRARVEAVRAAGIECAAWWYSCPRTTAGELALIADLVKNQGIAHLIQDAEIEWESVPGPDKSRVPHDFRPEAKVFAKQVRDAIGPDVFLADAPWARPRSHGGLFPYAELGSIMNARFPQLYWEVAEVDGMRFADFMAAADQQWGDLNVGVPICPAGSTVDAQGVRHCPVDELNAFLDRYATRQAVSLWSWQHMNNAEWALLAKRAQDEPKAPIAPGDDQPVYAAPPPGSDDPPQNVA